MQISIWDEVKAFNKNNDIDIWWRYQLAIAKMAGQSLACLMAVQMQYLGNLNI